MCDSVLYYSKIADKNINKENIQLVPIYEKRKISRWNLATVHRAENTLDDKNLFVILNVFEKLPDMVIFPVHPRIRKIVDKLNKENKYKNIYFVEPVDYLTMLYLTKNAEKTITDSGGLQKECYILDTPCITLREQTEWIETLQKGYNVLSKIRDEELYNKIINAKISDSNKINYYGDGKTSEKFRNVLLNL